MAAWPAEDMHPAKEKLAAAAEEAALSLWVNASLA
jgi:hypothetical protein